MRPERIVVTCEHGGNRIPTASSAHFKGNALRLRSHEGHDIGALQLARDISRALRAPLHSSTTSRLLVDLNRSLGHPELFSSVTKHLPEDEKERILRRHWHPYRQAVERRVETLQRNGRCVLHLSIHSFTPQWEGKTRDVDVGILFDPKREAETRFAESWIEELQSRRSDLAVHKNAPYRGWADGLATALRAQHPESRYLGIELEVSQRFPLGEQLEWRALRRDVCASLAEVVGAGPGALVP